MVSTKRRVKKIDPFASQPGENGPTRYNRLYAKGLSEGVYIERHTSTGIPVAINPTNGTAYTLTEHPHGWFCGCPQGSNYTPCKHVIAAFPPQPIRQPCPLCSGPCVARQEGTEHAVRCLNCHYVEQWQDSPPVPAGVDAETVYQELYQIERPK